MKKLYSIYHSNRMLSAEQCLMRLDVLSDQVRYVTTANE